MFHFDLLRPKNENGRCGDSSVGAGAIQQARIEYGLIRCRGAACAGMALWAVFSWGGLARAQTTATVTVSNRMLGRTPGLIGYNIGHWLPGSNTADWWQHSGVNAARIFLSPS